jgi:murein L,D-transpeptidase YafK
MIRSIRLCLLGMALFALAACGGGVFSGQYLGPEVTGIVVYKADRKMYLYHGNEVVQVYDVALGTNPVGPKQFEGDGKTPEGQYFISHRNPRSSFHLSLGISYPNAADRAYAAAQGKEPGGDIFIHGESPYPSGKQDWTVGCIAVTNAQMDVIYAMVAPGTPIWIKP